MFPMIPPSTARLHGFVLIGLALTACGGGDPDVDAPPPPTARPAVAEEARAPDTSRPAPPPALPSAMPAQVEGVPRWNPMSTSDADATPAQVWGEIIGKNVGAAQSCGVGQARIDGYLEGLKWQIRMVGGEASSPGNDYQHAYEQARASAAAQVRGEDACAEILSAIDG